jgi:hypothetical protein
LNSNGVELKIDRIQQETTMRSRLIELVFVCAACVAATSPARAVICYVIYDRGENVIYQSTYPPLDMSNAGYDQREALRTRGEHLTFGDVDRCPTVVFLTGSGGTRDLRVDDVVAGMPARTMLGATASGATASGATVRTPAGVQVRAARPRSGSY